MKQHMLIATISMDSTMLKKLLLSLKDNLDTSNLQLNVIVFMNNKNYVKPMLQLLDTDIIYVPLDSESSLDIASARTFIHSETYKYCQSHHIEPIVWFLDEDIEIDSRANTYLPKLTALKKENDVVIGSIEGDSPNSVFSGINVQLLDLIHNLNYLDTLKDDDIFPNFEKHNDILRDKYPDYYYDLSSRNSGHLDEFFYILPLDNKEKVLSVRTRIFKMLDNIISGQNIFRPIINKKVTLYAESLLRGANTFVLNLDTLKIKNPSIRIDAYTMRRSDMLWALINKFYLRKKIIKTDFVVLHNRKFNIEKELNTKKTIEENAGSVIFNAFKIYYENNQKKDFQSILRERADLKIHSIVKNYETIITNLKILRNLNKPELSHFIDTLTRFYNDVNRKIILDNLENIKNDDKNIFKQFISYVPFIRGVCFLEREDSDFYQYDIGDEDIKIFTKRPIENIDTNIPVSIRMHSSCCNSEVFGAIDCDCASQLEESMKMIEKTDNSILFYLNQEGRGHGYANKIAIVSNMQTKKMDTYASCQVLGLDDDIRDFSGVANILDKLNITTVEMATNNPRKIKMLENKAIKVQNKKQKLITHYTHKNIEYLISKQTIGEHKNLILSENILIKKYPYSDNKIAFYEKVDKYGGFSNFSDYPFFLDNKYWRTSEHYYQAHKFISNSDTYNEIQQSKKAMDAKNIAYSVKIDYDNWESKKLLFMHNALIAKFRQNNQLLQALIETKESYIIENAQDDAYWGCGLEKNGKNLLGRLLMFVRDELKVSPNPNTPSKDKAKKSYT